MLEIHDLHAGYGRTEVLHGVTMTIKSGTIVTMLGRNGAGKSTTLKAITGLLKATSGSVTFDGKDITHAKPHKVARLGISHVREGHQIFPALTVMENLSMGAFLRSGDENVQADLDRVISMFPVLRRKSNARGASLSGGEQQMLALAQGLMMSPRLLICDEPSLGLAPMVVQEIMDALLSLREGGITVLLVEQRVNHALAISDHVYVLDDGAVRHEGPAAEVRESDVLLDSYLGSVQ
ncbi:ABC transporter ATP-binding protein [Nocardioides gansuensis]|uniref:ABC transporter ATP-binding protein n=1 Tax=Nocardioides gansuensis TaxID=2138300 RepID=A0A2T8FD23_9ACTN|nr:ABC transporter ATP-binding protein [Nocardioides gansuensis]PVG83611.1 ABC transporter ATP-binding protein [Nocardioides gansuensis]